MALDLARFRTPSAFASAAEQCLKEVKAVPPIEGFDSVMIPGEPERQAMAERRREGIPLDGVLEAGLRYAAAPLGLDLDPLLGAKDT